MRRSAPFATLPHSASWASPGTRQGAGGSAAAVAAGALAQLGRLVPRKGHDLLLVGVLKTRAPGMTLARMPMFAWAMLVVGVMILFAFTPLIVASTLLEFDRKLGTHFFNPDFGGKPVTTGTLSSAIQIIEPGESAEPHRPLEHRSRVPYESRWAPYVRAHGPGQVQLPLGSIRPRGYDS